MGHTLPATPTMLRRYDAVLFDLDGTLADSTADITHALGRALDDLGMVSERPVETLVDGSPLEEIFALAAPRAGGEVFTRFVARYRHHSVEGAYRNTRLYPGVRDTLEALRFLRPALRVAVATARRVEAARALLEATEIAGHFDHIAGSGGTSLAPKPSPDLLLHVAASLGVSPSRALMVGDTVRDVSAGRRAGMTTAAVLYGLGDRDALYAASPDHMLEDIEDLLPLLQG